MATLVMRGRLWLREPFVTGFLLLVILITLFLGKPLFTNQPLLAADLLYHLDPLWQPMAPPGFTVPTNQVLSDQVFEFYPWQKFVREALAAGQLPLWNPYVYAGHPLLANAQSAPFDPFNLLAYLWPLAQSFVVVAFLRLLCAGSFTLLLALELGMSRWAAYVSMVTFTFAMPQVVWLLYPKASVLVWLPAVLFLSLRVIRFCRWRDAGLLGLVMAAQIVGGHPETVLYSVLLWGIFCLYWLWAEAESVMRRALQLVSAGLLGMGAGAMQWLPVAEALLNSEILANRSQSSLTWESIFLQWREWLAGVTMLMPNFFGNPRHADYWYPYSNFTEQTLYVGLLPLALACLLIWRREKARPVLFFGFVALFALAMALRLPGFALLAEVPPLNITNPARMRSVYMLCVALLAGFGLDVVRQEIVHGDSRSMRLLLRLLLLMGGLATLAAASAYWGVSLLQERLVEMARSQAESAQGNPFFFRPLEEYQALAEMRVAQIIASFHPANWMMYLPLLLALALWLVWRLVQRFAPQLRAGTLAVMFATVMLAAAVGDLWLFGFDYNPTVAAEDVYPTPPLMEILLQERDANAPFRVVGTGLALVPNVSMVFGLEDIRGYDPIAPRRYMEFVSRVDGAVRVGHHLLFRQIDARFLDFLNVQYAFVAGDTGSIDARWQRVAEEQGVTIYANTGAMPRAFMVYDSMVAATPAESLEMTLAPDFDFRNSVVLEGVDAPWRGDAPDHLPLVATAHYAPGEMTVEVETAADGLLVVSDPYTPGWVARVDGEAAELLIANHAFRAVAVPQGKHTITFAYQPLSVTVGAWISGASLVMLLVILLVGGRRVTPTN